MLSIRAVIRTAFAALALVAIGRQLVLHVGASYSPLNFFSYFTNLSNLIAALVLLLLAFVGSLASNRLMVLIRFVSAANMTVVGLVFAVLLRDVELGGLLPWINFVLHYVMPVVVLLDWLLNPPAMPLRWNSLLLALVFPAIYLVYVVLRGMAIGWYPYPFLNPANVGGYAGVALYALGIAVTFVVAGGLLLALGNRLSAARSSNAAI